MTSLIELYGRSRLGLILSMRLHSNVILNILCRQLAVTFLNGPIPPQIGYLQNLKILSDTSFVIFFVSLTLIIIVISLSDTSLAAFFRGLCRVSWASSPNSLICMFSLQLQNLRQLMFVSRKLADTNLFTGILPDSFSNLKSVTNVQFWGNNRFVGCWPAGFGNSTAPGFTW
jgi:hypothetical protein